MFKTIEDLAKAASDLSQHFKKAGAHHAAVAEHHKAMHEFTKAKQESMDDGDVLKTYFGKLSDFHKGKHELHKAHSEHLAEMCNAYGGGEEGKAAPAPAAKAAAPAPAAPTTEAEAIADGKAGVEAMMKETTTGLVKSALQMLKEDPYIQEQIKLIVLDGVRSAVGKEIEPIPGVHKVIGPPQGLQAVPRKGQPEVPNAEKVDPMLADMVSA